MNIIGYNASPRREGNTAWSVNKVLSGAKEAGAETQNFHSADLKIGPCLGCLGCVQSGKCVVKDDMHGVYACLATADVLVFGMPIYMGQMSAQAKIFTDRLFAQITPRFSPRFKEENAGKKLVLLFTQGNPNRDMFREYCDYTKRMFQLLEFDVLKMQIIAGTRSNPACEDKELCAVLTETGKLLV